MKAAAPTRRHRFNPSVAGVPDRIAQAVRNSLNLPKLHVDVRRSNEPAKWQVRLRHGIVRSEWLTLNPAAVDVIKKVSLLPPKLLGQFRLAYDAIKTNPAY